MQVNEITPGTTSEVVNAAQMSGGMNIEMIFIIVLAIISAVLLIMVIILFVKLSKMNNRLKIFMSGRDAISLEESITILEEDNIALKEHAARSKKDIRNLSKKLEGAYQKMGLVKYDAFQQMGGQLSFSLAMLDEHNDGFIINSVHSTDGCYSYTKPILNGECELALGKEEQQALDIAKAKK